ncbi:MAG: hypothetical protein JST33_06080 [Actinobacteria bacterium]|nr:hypothetical protein [Actinomycetota bacterium]
MKIRTGLTIAALAASLTIALAGCTLQEPAAAPVPTADSTSSPEPSTDPAAAWLDGGRSIGLVTWGSSSLACAPVAEDVKADGQTITVTLAEPDPKAVCTADFTARATFVGVPEGVDPTKDVTVAFQGAAFQGRLPLAGNSTLKAGGSSDGKPSAGWFSENGILLLTWGSSTCRPVVSDLTEEKAGATVTFQTDATQVCTMDFVPRITVLGVTAPADPADYTLTLKGDHLDGTVKVIG